MSSIGVLVWAVVPESSSSLYKTLVANVEFMRHKVKLDDRFLGHKEAVLELGKDVRPVLFVVEIELTSRVTYSHLPYPATRCTFSIFTALAFGQHRQWSCSY